MKWKKWLKKWDMTSLKIKPPFLEMEWKPKNEDKDAAWDLYIELLTRITTQPLPADSGNEKAALESIYSMFSLTRNVIKGNGRNCMEFTKIAIIVLNQKIRPFTSKWHKLSEQNAFSDTRKCKEFRKELSVLQNDLQIYTQMLADMAGVENLVELEGET